MKGMLFVDDPGIVYVVSPSQSTAQARNSVGGVWLITSS